MSRSMQPADLPQWYELQVVALKKLEYTFPDNYPGGSSS